MSVKLKTRDRQTERASDTCDFYDKPNELFSQFSYVGGILHYDCDGIVCASVSHTESASAIVITNQQQNKSCSLSLGAFIKIISTSTHTYTSNGRVATEETNAQTHTLTHTSILNDYKRFDWNSWKGTKNINDNNSNNCYCYFDRTQIALSTHYTHLSICATRIPMLSRGFCLTI